MVSQISNFIEEIDLLMQSEIENFYPKSQREWRQWLRKNHKAKQSVWLILYKKQSGKPSMAWSDAVDEALCYGWIDSVRRPIDDEKFKQFFGKRKPSGTWSKINKDKVEYLIANKRMAKAGLLSIETAKQNGSWTILDKVETLKIPTDLSKEFKTQPGSKEFFMSLSKSVKKAMLQWLVLAKRPETRQRRISEIAKFAAEKQKPKQF
jgi:uncharacterized protein YdeI (YjbR/CyaY-like superfamily)